LFGSSVRQFFGSSVRQFFGSSIFTGHYIRSRGMKNQLKTVITAPASQHPSTPALQHSSTPTLSLEYLNLTSAAQVVRYRLYDKFQREDS